MRNDRDSSAEHNPPPSMVGRRADGGIRSSTAVRGIPKMFRWLVDLFPQITHDISTGTLSGRGERTTAVAEGSVPLVGRRDSKAVVHDLAFAGADGGGVGGASGKRRAVDNRVDNLYIDM
jgi:5'-3' exonuclease